MIMVMEVMVWISVIPIMMVIYDIYDDGIDV